MIQRIQTIWLLAASACGFATLYSSFYIGSIGNAPAEHFTAMSNVFILIFTVITATVSLVDIFLYKNRKLQMRLALGNTLLYVIVILLYFNNIKKYTAGGLSLLSVFVFIIPVLLLLAIRGMRKDEKLVRSADRLR
jgi:hypothetical protein